MTPSPRDHHWIAARGGLLAAALAVCFATTGWAQVRPDAGTILDTVREPAGQARPEARGLDVPPVRPRMVPPTGIKVRATGFAISGNTVFPEAEILKDLAEFANKELDDDGLRDVLQAVTIFYRSRGYFLATAYFPAQELKGGVIQIHVLEGRLGQTKVNVKPGASLRPWMAEGYLSRIERGAIAEEGAVERPLLLLQDLRGVQVRSVVSPGAQTGEADLTVEIDDGRRVAGVVEVENYGNKFAGAIRLSGQLFANNLLGVGDQLSLRGLLSQDTLTQVMGISYAVPVGYWGTKVGASYSELRYRLGGSLGTSAASGDAELASVLVVHPFLRTRAVNVFGQVSFDVKDLEDRLGVANILEQRRIKGVKLGVFGDWRDFVMSGGLNTFSFTATSGRVTLINPALAARDVNEYQTAGSYTKYNVDFQRVQRITEGVHGVFRGTYQTASKNLVSSEKISVGGPLGVRAYPVGEGLADDALQITAEVRYTIPGMKLLSGDVTLAGFVDGAQVRRFNTPNPTIDIDPITRLPNANRRTLWGAGVGVRLGKQGDFTVNADLAWRVGDEPPQSDISRNPRVWVHGAWWF